MKKIIVFLSISLFVCLLVRLFTYPASARLSHASDTLSTAAPAAASMHTIQFTTGRAIPANGKIVITFPGTGSNATTASSSTFAFNGLAPTSISYNLGGPICSFNVTAPTITCTTSAQIPANTVVTFLIGCLDISHSETSCTNKAPQILNPTKTASVGNADIWTISLATENAGDTTLDSWHIALATVENVTVRADIDPSLTFIIKPIPDNTMINTATYCTAGHEALTTNSGITPTATNVSLGQLDDGLLHRAGQTLTVASNAISGYSLVAYSSGHFTDPSSASYLQNAQGETTADDAPSPKPMTDQSGTFGVHFCDSLGNVNTASWGSFQARFANPSGNFFYTLADPVKPPSGNGDVYTAIYQAAASPKNPSGNYQETITYILSPRF